MGAISDPNQDGSDEQQLRSEIYTYEAPWHIYAMNWSVRRDKKYRLAISSLLEQYPNRVEIVQLDDSTGEIRPDPALSFDHPYPPTKLIFVPDKDCQRPDLLASSSDFLRLWQISDSDSSRRVELKSLLNNNRNSEFSGPLTSFDWNEAEPRRIGTSSIDTTCTIWDIEKEVVDTQLIAHDKEVYDIAWGGVGVFASVSADGSVRVFDLRDKEHSTIIYESSEPDTPLVRLGWNKQDPRYMATIIMDSSKVVVLDIRFPTLPVVELQRHQAGVNAIAWAPHSSCHICTAGDDSQALIWDLSSMGQPVEGGLDPILAYTAGAEIEQLQWSYSQPDWVAIAFSNKLQILRCYYYNAELVVASIRFNTVKLPATPAIDYVKMILLIVLMNTSLSNTVKVLLCGMIFHISHGWGIDWKAKGSGIHIHHLVIGSIELKSPLVLQITEREASQCARVGIAIK
ncbi:hypothetical protein SASPL_132571 [Salvia splendens]|uniref:WD repeat-containing protein 68 n=1 Tax=Salvia splendens TaxID=180675 RepID=A0A8X8X271_SALSN|nr:hypothetical protein SASPL_132571 [Salvia splendens]